MPVGFFRRSYSRAFQFILYIGSFFLPWPRPKLLKGEGCIKNVPSLLKKNNLCRSLLVTDEGLMKIGLMNSLINCLEAEGLVVTVYGKVQPNPTVGIIEDAVALYKENQCDHIIGFGGGSAIDSAKVVGARIARPKKSIRKMKGLFGVLWKLPPVIAIPTTAGTGSECTLAAVVSCRERKEKYALEDPFLFPPYAVLDPQLTVNLPRFVTATTGIDTLTHGIESYLSIFQTRQTEKDAIQAIKLTFKYLQRAFDTGEDLEAREKMQEAAYLGGLAFTRAYVGNVHAVAHALGGFYNVPHGYANAVALPFVLDAYGSSVHKKLAHLADEVGLSADSLKEKATAFISAVKHLNAAMDIPPTLGPKYPVQNEDIEKMAEHAFREATPLYPVPVIFSKADFVDIFKKVSDSDHALLA